MDYDDVSAPKTCHGMWSLYMTLHYSQKLTQFNSSIHYTINNTGANKRLVVLVPSLRSHVVHVTFLSASKNGPIKVPR